MAKAIKVAVTKNGKLLKGSATKARVFSSKVNARNFIKNLVRVSNNLTTKNFEIIELSR